MSESAAMVLHLAEQAPQAGLAPAAGDPARPDFLRWLVFLVAAIYPNFTYGDEPARYVTGEEAGKELRATTDAYAQRCWRMVEPAVHAEPWFLGSGFSALDLYLAVMTRWRPRRPWFALHCPKVHAVALEADRGAAAAGGVGAELRLSATARDPGRAAPALLPLLPPAGRLLCRPGRRPAAAAGALVQPVRVQPPAPEPQQLRGPRQLRPHRRRSHGPRCHRQHLPLHRPRRGARAGARPGAGPPALARPCLRADRAGPPPDPGLDHAAGRGPRLPGPALGRVRLCRLLGPRPRAWSASAASSAIRARPSPPSC